MCLEYACFASVLVSSLIPSLQVGQWTSHTYIIVILISFYFLFQYLPWNTPSCTTSKTAVSLLSTRWINSCFIVFFTGTIWTFRFWFTQSVILFSHSCFVIIFVISSTLTHDSIQKWSLSHERCSSINPDLIIFSNPKMIVLLHSGHDRCSLLSRLSMNAFPSCFLKLRISVFFITYLQMGI